MKKKVLISGGAGFIGSAFARKLIDHGNEVKILDNFTTQIHGENRNSYTYKLIAEKVELIKGDVRSHDDWLRALKDIEVVVHLAAETGTGQSMYEIEKYVDVNTLGTSILLDLLTNTSHDVKKVIVASSRAVYGEGKYHCNDHGIVYPRHRLEEDLVNGNFECRCPICDEFVYVLPTDENTEINPSSVYGATKFQQEQLVMIVCKALGIKALSFRYQNVYGPGQSLQNPYTGILSIFSNLIRSGKDINIFEDGMESRDFVYIDDVVDATYLGIMDKAVNYGIYNVGTGVQTNVMQVVEALDSCYKMGVQKYISGNFRIGDIRHNFADISKIKKELGFIPKTKFVEGIRKFTEWVLQQDISDNKYLASLNEMKSKGLLK